MSPLAPLEVAPRAERVRAGFADAGIDALLVTKLVNIRWLTGFTGSAAMLLVRPDEMILVTDGRYEEQAHGELASTGVDATIEVRRSQDEQRSLLASLVSATGRLGLEAASIAWSQVRTFSDLFSGVELVATTELVEAPRACKDAGEVARMARAATIAGDALVALMAELGRGITEEAFAVELDTEMRRRGAEGPSFPTIVASGPNASRPHHRPGSRPVGCDELVIVDFGARFDGYCSDMTRTIVVGHIGAEQRRMVEVVTAAEAAGVQAVCAGAETKAIDDTCRRVIGAAGWADAFVHGTGHGVGLEIHEDPWLGKTTTSVLAAGHVVTVEPGVYVAGVGGVRVEDLLVVEAHGCHPLTHTAKDLVVEVTA